MDRKLARSAIGRYTQSYLLSEQWTPGVIAHSVAAQVVRTGPDLIHAGVSAYGPALTLQARLE